MRAQRGRSVRGISHRREVSEWRERGQSVRGGRSVREGDGLVRMGWSVRGRVSEKGEVRHRRGKF